MKEEFMLSLPIIQKTKMYKIRKQVSKDIKIMELFMMIKFSLI